MILNILVVYNIILVVREIIVVVVVVREIIVVVREIIGVVVVVVVVVVVREIVDMTAVAAPSVTSLKLFTFCFYIGKNSYQELVRMLFVLIASLDQYHPDFFLVVYHNLGIVIDDPRVRMVNGGIPPPNGGSEWEVKDGGDGGSERLLLDADGCAGNVWVEGSAVRNRWYKLNFNRVHAFKNLYDEYDGECFTWIDLDTIVLADLSYLAEVDNYFIFHGGGGGGGGGGRMHDVLVDGGGRVVWSVPEASYIHGSFWKLNLSLYHEVLRLDSLFRENGVRLKYDVQSIFSVMARGGGGGRDGYGGYGRCPFYDGPSRAMTGSMLVIGENIKVCVMNGLGVWDNKDSVGNHVNTDSLTNFRWSDSGSIFRTSMYPDKEIHILSLTFDSFFMSNVCGSSDFVRLFPFLLV